MPWESRTVLQQRRDFIAIVNTPGITLAEAARRFGISRECARTWRDRHRRGGLEALEDLSRRPARSPDRLDASVEDAIVRLRTAHPAWGPRKIARLLVVDRVGRAAPSTVVAVLRRHGLIGPRTPRPASAGRFERDAPNSLWQMDYKGPVVTRDGATWHPLTVIDDHSRYAIAVRCCADQTLETLLPALRTSFGVYGMPDQILCDNGKPWRGDDPAGRLTRCEIWLMERGVEMIHGRPRHPQTQGKDERFNRTLDVELLRGREYADGERLALAAERWREIYNHRRPHDALGLEVPASRFTASVRPFDDRVLPWEYGPDDVMRRVARPGAISFRGRTFRVGKGLIGRSVGVRPTDVDGVFEVRFRKLLVRAIDLRERDAA